MRFCNIYRQRNYASSLKSIIFYILVYADCTSLDAQSAENRFQAAADRVTPLEIDSREFGIDILPRGFYASRAINYVFHVCVVRPARPRWTITAVNIRVSRRNTRRSHCEYTCRLVGRVYKRRSKIEIALYLAGLHSVSG